MFFSCFFFLRVMFSFGLPLTFFYFFSVTYPIFFASSLSLLFYRYFLSFAPSPALTLILTSTFLTSFAFAFLTHFHSHSHSPYLSHPHSPVLRLIFPFFILSTTHFRLPLTSLIFTLSHPSLLPFLLSPVLPYSLSHPSNSLIFSLNHLPFVFTFFFTFATSLTFTLTHLLPLAPPVSLSPFHSLYFSIYLHIPLRFQTLLPFWVASSPLLVPQFPFPLLFLLPILPSHFLTSPFQHVLVSFSNSFNFFLSLSNFELFSFSFTFAVYLVFVYSFSSSVFLGDFSFFFLS